VTALCFHVEATSPTNNMVVPALPTRSLITNSTSPEKQQNCAFVSINCLEYVTIIINYCAALMVFYEDSSNDDPNPVVICVTDNISAKNWILHTSKKSIIGQALAIFFYGLLVGSNIGIDPCTTRLLMKSQGSRLLTLHHQIHIMTTQNSNRITRN
jgi:hypothetical protein